MTTTRTATSSSPAPLPLAVVDRTIITPALALLPPRMDSREARLLMLAIGRQESRLQHRRQLPTGPARGLWQFERGGGVLGVLNHPATMQAARNLCACRAVAASASDVHAALEHDDVLAAGFARLLLFSDPRPLPHIARAAAAWTYYIDTWRPGKPHRHTWDRYHAEARVYILEQEAQA